MATVGSLVVELAASTAKFQADLGKAVSSAEGAAKQISSAFDFARNALTALTGGLTIGAFVNLVKGSIDAADRLNDLSQSTGIAVDVLGGLGLSARQSGTDLESVAKAVGKFNIKIAEATAGNADASRLFQTLGISMQQLKASSPDQVLAMVADRFASYKDGANKAALGNAAFGKTFADVIPLLNEGGASILRNTEYFKKFSGVTPEMTKRADEFNDTLEKLKLLSGAFANHIASALLPRLQGLANGLVEVKEKGDGFKSTADDIADVTIGIAKAAVVASVAYLNLGEAIGAKFAQAASIAKLDFAAVGAIGRAVEEDGKARVARMDALFAKLDNRTVTIRDKGKGGGGKDDAPGMHGKETRIREVTDSAKKYLETLEKQLERTEELSTVEQTLNDVMRERVTFLAGGVTLDQLLGTAAQVDDAKRLKAALEEVAKVDAAARADVAKRIESAQRESEGILASNDALRQHIEEIGKDENGLRALAQARLADAIAIKEQELATKQLNGATGSELDALREQIKLLRERGTLFDKKSAAEDFAAEAAKAKQFSDELGHSLAQGAEEAILHFRSLRDVLKGVEQDLLRIITRKLVTEPLGNYLSNFLGTAMSGIGAGAGAGAASGWVSGGDLPLGSFAVGSNFVPRTQLALVHRGEKIIPAAQNRAGGGGNTIHAPITINVPDTTDRRTADQVAAAAYSGLMRARRVL